MKQPTPATGWMVAIVILLTPHLIRSAEPADPPPQRWSREVEAYARRDAAEPFPQGGIVFAGSSSIRMWPDLQEAMEPHRVLGRGIGGSHISDQVYWAERLILRHSPRQIVFYAGDNDVASGKKAERVLKDFKRFVAKVRRNLPDVWVHFLAIKPSPRREKFWPEMARANRLVREYAENDPRTTFVDVAEPMLDQNGRPRRDIFLKDMLHMNREGYALWVPLVRQALERASKAQDRKRASPRADVVFENKRFRAVLGADATWRSLRETAGDAACLPDGPQPSFAAVRIDGKWHDAASASRDGDTLALSFAGVDTRLTYRVETRPGWVAFRIDKVDGTRPTDVVAVRLATAVCEHVGPRLCCGWNERVGVCLMTTGLQSTGKARQRDSGAELTVTSRDTPGPRLEGAGAALVVAPTADLNAVLRRVAKAYGLPTNTNADGVPSKRLPLARRSYWFLRFGAGDVDRVLDCCRRSGFRQVMMVSQSWCKDVGHYTFRKSAYPEGLDSLRRTVARLHDEGIRVGMHGYASKISKTDAYVTPVPDRRFWVDRTATLAEAIDAGATSIRTGTDLRQWPGSPVASQKRWEGGVAKHREVIIDDEIIQYESIGPKGKWHTFLGCRRGAWGTRAAPHAAGTTCRHYGVDGCINGYIIDQETDLLDEATDRLAHVFNTCGFDMVYFDGGEDVDRRRFHHYVSKFQAVTMSKFTKRPLVHMGTVMTHGLWHSFTRSGTVDTYRHTIRGRLVAGGTWEKVPTVHDHIDNSVDYLLRCREDRVPGELGWFGIWPRSKDFEGLQLDEIEYLMAKSLAYDAPVSLQTSFRKMDAHPLTPGILEIVRAYESLRLGRGVHADVCRRLRRKGVDFVLLRRDPDAQPEFVRVNPLDTVAGEDDLRACVGQTADGAIATLWHAVGKPGRIFMEAAADRVRASDVFGRPIALPAAEEGTIALPFGHRRTTVLFEGLGADAVRRHLAEAEARPRPPVCVWLQAEDAERLVGKMARGSHAGVAEPGALGEVVLCTGHPSPREPKPWYAEYAVRVPHGGRWTLWARVRYPAGADHSFGLVRPNEEVTLSGRQVLGNCGRNGKRWHWTGRGGGSTTVPPGKPIVLRLREGRFVFRIYAREGGASAQVNPRLDMLCLSDTPDYVPTDADARAAFEHGGE